MGFVGPGLALIGTAAGIIERSNANAQRNQQLAEQQRAVTRAEYQKLLSLSTRQAFAAYQTDLELMANHARATQQLSAVALQLESAKFQAASGFLQRQQAITENELKLLVSQAAARNVELQKVQDAAAVGIQSLQRAGQQSAQIAQMYAELSNAINQNDTARATAIAQRISSQGQDKKPGTSQYVQSESDRQRQVSELSQRNYQINLDLLKGGSADERVIQDLLYSDEFQGILRETGLLDAALIRGQSGLQAGVQQQGLNKYGEALNAGLAAQRQGAESLYESIPLSASIRDNQALINQGYQNIYLAETQDGISTDSAAQRASLGSQMTGSTFWSDAFSLVNAGLPLISSFVNAEQRASTPLTPQLSSQSLSFMTPNEIAISSVNTQQLLDTGFSNRTSNLRL